MESRCLAYERPGATADTAARPKGFLYQEIHQGPVVRRLIAVNPAPSRVPPSKPGYGSRGRSRSPSCGAKAGSRHDLRKHLRLHTTSDCRSHELGHPLFGSTKTNKLSWRHLPVRSLNIIPTSKFGIHGHHQAASCSSTQLQVIRVSLCTSAPCSFRSPPEWLAVCRITCPQNQKVKCFRSFPIPITSTKGFWFCFPVFVHVVPFPLPQCHILETVSSTK